MGYLTTSDKKIETFKYYPLLFFNMTKKTYPRRYISEDTIFDENEDMKRNMLIRDIQWYKHHPKKLRYRPTEDLVKIQQIISLGYDKKYTKQDVEEHLKFNRIAHRPDPYGYRTPMVDSFKKLSKDRQIEYINKQLIEKNKLLRKTDNETNRGIFSSWERSNIVEEIRQLLNTREAIKKGYY